MPEPWGWLLALLPAAALLASSWAVLGRGRGMEIWKLSIGRGRKML